MILMNISKDYNFEYGSQRVADQDFIDFTVTRVTKIKKQPSELQYSLLKAIFIFFKHYRDD